ncbi:MAG: TonB-dependent receptor [Candidatus Cloacimonetes bacterium]|nr:TonB-dependent receptor [Candidatus Cloacimonadota bacterium]
MQKRLIILALCLVAISSSLFAQTTGKLAGVVLDDRNQPVPYANIVLQGTQTGGTADQNGRFVIINITPGTYTVHVSAVGHTSFVMHEVRISVDDTRSIQAKLNRDSIEQDVITVVAPPDLIKKDAPSTKIISSDDIENLAVSDVEGLLSMSAGVSKNADGGLNVRGGRTNEVVFTVDGMSVSDPVDGGRALSVDMDAIADMKVMTGGFTAEYGNAQSGMVNIVTKDGSERWEGKIEGITDHGHQIQKGSNYDEIKFAFGGPVPVYWLNQSLRSKFTFFLNGAASWSDTRYRKHYSASPNGDFSFTDREDLVYLISSQQYDWYNPYEGRDDFLGFDLGNRNSNNYNFNLKTTYQLSPLKKLTLAVRGDRSYAHPFRHDRRYALQHYAESDARQGQVLLTYDHVFDARRVLQVKGSYFTSITKQSPRHITFKDILYDNGRFDPDQGSIDNGNFGFSSIDSTKDGIYDFLYPSHTDWSYNIRGLPDPRDIQGFLAPGTIWDRFIDDESAQYTLRGDYEYQISQIVGMKTGLEIIQHDIKKNQLIDFLTRFEERFLDYLKYNCQPDSVIEIDGVERNIYSRENYMAAGYASSGRRDGYKAKPMQFAYYLQGKADWEGMIVNLGLRTDLWYLGKDYDILLDNGSYRKNNTKYLKDPDTGDYIVDPETGHRIAISSGFDSKDVTQVMLSPRLSVSHPISEKQVVHFAYNYQNQLPQMRYIFTTRDSVDAYIQGPGVTVGNPTLKPQITVTYEVGLQQLLTEDYVLGVTAYYKNIYNYVSTRKVTSKQEASLFWYEYISEDYGSARGVDLTLNRRMYNFLAGGINYSLAWANGNNSETIVQDETKNIREFPLDWDIRHQLNFNIAHRVARGEEFILPFTDWAVPFDDYLVSLNYFISSGRPYTPMALDTTDMLETNSKRMPYTSSADLRFSKNFNTGKTSYVRATFTIENLFKFTNVNNVYPRTGSPYKDDADISETSYPGYVFHETQFLHDLYTANPSYINRDRNYILTLGYNF